MVPDPHRPSLNISVIVATYRRPDILFLTLESLCHLQTHGLKWEIIVVDNADDQKTRNVVSHFQDRLPVHYLVEVRRGKNNALNKAVETARGDLFVFTDDDITADPRWLMEVWEGSQRWPDIAIFGGKIVALFPPGKIPISRGHPFFSGAYAVLDRGIDEGRSNPKEFWGPNLAIRSHVFHEGWRYNPDIGPNGDNYIMGSETELLKRLHQAGMSAVFLPNSLVYHRIRPEQLEVAWLYRRAFKFGRFQAVSWGKPDVPYLFGAPRFLYRRLVMLYLQRIRHCLDTEKRIDLGITHWMLRGNLYQYRKESRQET